MVELVHTETGNLRYFFFHQCLVKISPFFSSQGIFHIEASSILIAL